MNKKYVILHLIPIFHLYPFSWFWIFVQWIRISQSSFPSPRVLSLDVVDYDGLYFNFFLCYCTISRNPFKWNEQPKRNRLSFFYLFPSRNNEFTNEGGILMMLIYVSSHWVFGFTQFFPRESECQVKDDLTISPSMRRILSKESCKL